MSEGRKSIVAIVVFYVVAILLRFLTNKTQLLSGLDSGFIKTILQGAGPAIGALFVFILFKVPVVMTLKGNFRNILIPFSIYWLLPIAVITSASYLTKGTFPILLIMSILIYGLLEEIGWRGFLQQQLKPLPRFLGILVLTVMWFVWHLNFDLSTSNLIFFMILLFGTWGIGLVADRTNSLLAVSAFHSLNNFFSDMNSLKLIILIVLMTTWVLSIVFRARLERRQPIDRD